MPTRSTATRPRAIARTRNGRTSHPAPSGTLPPGQFCVQVQARVNIANDSPAASRLVARDSAQVATRIPQPACDTAGPPVIQVDHCGKQSIWDVASGGRMGFVTGEDAVEVANPPTKLHRGLPGAEPGPRATRRARVPVPGPGGQPADSADRRVQRTADRTLRRHSRRPRCTCGPA